MSYYLSHPMVLTSRRQRYAALLLLSSLLRHLSPSPRSSQYAKLGHNFEHCTSHPELNQGNGNTCYTSIIRHGSAGHSDEISLQRYGRQRVSGCKRKRASQLAREGEQLASITFITQIAGHIINLTHTNNFISSLKLRE